MKEVVKAHPNECQCRPCTSAAAARNERLPSSIPLLLGVISNVPDQASAISSGIRSPKKTRPSGCARRNHAETRAGESCCQGSAEEGCCQGSAEESWYLRARQVQKQVQRLRRQRYLRARQAKKQVQRLQMQRYLRARQVQKPVQRLRR